MLSARPDLAEERHEADELALGACRTYGVRKPLPERAAHDAGARVEDADEWSGREAIEGFGCEVEKASETRAIESRC